MVSSTLLSNLHPFCIILILSGVLSVIAQATDESERNRNDLFRWRFANNFLSTTLPACEPRPIIITGGKTNLSELGTPPYYMIAFANNGTPRKYDIGSDPNNLTWIPDLDIGTKMVLTVVDTNNGAGGSGGSKGSEDDQLFTIGEPAGNGSCVKPQPSTSSFTVAADTKNLQPLDMCDPWNIEVTGGTPPYEFLIVQPTSPNNTVVDNPPDKDAFVYVNRATTGLFMAVAVSDSKGQFATGTPVVMVSGNTNPDDCQGNSKSITKVELAQQRASDQARARKKKQIATALGVTFGLVVPLLAAGLYYWSRRCGRVRKVRVLARNGSDPALAERKDLDEAFPWSEPSAPLSIIPPRFETGVTPFNSSSPQSLRANPSFTTFPMSSAAIAKAAEARAQRQNSYGSTRQLQPGSRRPSIVIQHEDGGEIRELPPPYADRSARPPQDEELIVGSSSASDLPVSPPVFSPPELVPLTAGLSEVTTATEKAGDLERGTSATGTSRV